MKADKYVTLMSVYAPTMDRPFEEKDRFYSQLHNVLSSVPKTDMLYLLGDLNARVGRKSNTWPAVLGAHGVGNCSSNGTLLLTPAYCEFQLSITNTFYRLPHNYKKSSMHPRSKTWHLIDYVITRQSNTKNVNIERSLLWN